MRTYYLCRKEDVSGNSGTGRVAQVAEFDDGTTVVHWGSGTNSCGVTSTEVFQSVADLLKVHGHQGRTVLELDQIAQTEFLQPLQNVQHLFYSEITKNRGAVVRMKNHELEHFRRVLESHREEALRSLVRAEAEGRETSADYPQDVGDRSVANFSKEFLFQQSTHKRQLLRKIEAALKRVAQGIFGECANCGNEISLKRLDAMPWTEYCRECQENLERRSLAAPPRGVSAA